MCKTPTRKWTTVTHQLRAKRIRAYSQGASGSHRSFTRFLICGSASAASYTGASDADSCVAPAVPIGVGVGVGVLLLLVCLALGWLLLRERTGGRSDVVGLAKGGEPLSYAVEIDDRHNAHGSLSPAPSYDRQSTRDELDQATMMHQQREASQQRLSELATERGRVELGQ